MKYVKWSFVGFLTFLLSTSMFQAFRIAGVLFNSGVILAVVVTIIHGWKEGLASIITYAIFVDLFASRLLGINLLIYVALVIAIEFTSREFYRNSILMPFLYFVVVTLSYHLLYLVMMFLFGAVIPIEQLVFSIVVEIVYNSVLGYLVYYLAFWRTKGFKLGENHV